MVSSSMPVRDVEAWSTPRAGRACAGQPGRQRHRRRALDGARGGRRRAPGGVVALLGDLAFLYDAGALLAGGRGGARPDLDVVVVDNDGGGIFNFLAQAGTQPPERFERMWGTPQGADLAAVARAYGAEAEEVGDMGRLASALGGPEPGQGVRVLDREDGRVGQRGRAPAAVRRRRGRRLAWSLGRRLPPDRA